MEHLESIQNVRVPIPTSYKLDNFTIFKRCLLGDTPQTQFGLETGSALAEKTGTHSDGSIKFWDASCGTLQVLYKLKTSKVFERPTPKSQDGSDDDPFAVQHLSLCPESRKMCVAGAAGYVVLFKFKRQEATSETVVRYRNLIY
ncbi:unnamed protein product [Nesidiocoris tenuis]|uniref:Uncharacterized protein n=1 Tax=Nesidiocoris tenuis TaxID=355587 RepID=A0A6H5G1A0_9HEMI|nr:unnamed protein product [Nesidiocoris tenuis]